MVLPRTPSFRLDGKRALVTGASRGIGLGGAVALAEAGAHVVMVARNQSDIEAAAQSVNAEQLSATGVSLDVQDQDGIAQLIKEHGPFDVLFNNAGTNKPEPYTDVSTDNFDTCLLYTSPSPRDRQKSRMPSSA